MNITFNCYDGDVMKSNGNMCSVVINGGIMSISESIEYEISKRILSLFFEKKSKKFFQKSTLPPVPERSRISVLGRPD